MNHKGKSPETILGHNLTWAEFEVLNSVQDYMRVNAGDSHWSSSTSPRGDGREVTVSEIFGARNNQDNARRRTLGRLESRGILRVCEIRYQDGLLKGVPIMPPKTENHPGCKYPPGECVCPMSKTGSPKERAK